MIGAFHIAFREDKFYASPNFEYYSLTNDKPETKSFETYTEKFMRLYPGYRVDA